jgi:hypothetical protein
MKLLFALLLTSLPTWAQQAPVANSLPAQASVRFSFDWSQGVPWQSYSITVDSDGKARFEGVPHPDETNDTDTYRQEFTLSDGTRQRLFSEAQKLNYFRSDLDAHLKHIAQTGRKTLQYRSPEMQGSATYNYSQNADVQQLTQLFQGVAMTIDYGRKLAFQYRFDKLGMDQRLKELEDLEADHNAEELAIIAPTLRKIADDPNLMNITRESARRLLHSIAESAVAAQNPASK